MDIISLKFAILSIVSVLIFYLFDHKYRNGYLAILSSCFIASFSYYLLIYIIFYSLINYFIGLKIQDSRYKIALYRTGIIVNLLQLILMNYSSFLINPILNIYHSDLIISKLSGIIVPVGISYFTLQGIGYLINVKMGWEKPEKQYLSFLIYISFFPKFLSGPIERSNHFLPQLRLNNQFNIHEVSNGLRIALIGIFKKVAIANQLAPFIHNTYSNLNEADGSLLWITLFLQPLYLYFDFSGYTDIAIGLSRTFGINLLPNFDRPFFSENMTTFWKKFHISLSSWFNDYVFKQLSYKNRKWGVFASVYGLLVTWILFGVWHGAGWNFMFLGLVQSLAIIYEFFTKHWRVKTFSTLPVYFRILLSRFFTYFFYGSSLVFFFSPDLKSAFIYFSKLFKIYSSIHSVFLQVMREVPLSAIVLLIFFLGIELIENDFNNTFKKMENKWLEDKSMYFRWIIYYSIITILFVLGNRIQQFIYAQF